MWDLAIQAKGVREEKQSKQSIEAVVLEGMWGTWDLLKASKGKIIWRAGKQPSQGAQRLNV